MNFLKNRCAQKCVNSPCVYFVTMGCNGVTGGYKPGNIAYIQFPFLPIKTADENYTADASNIRI